MFLLCSLCAHNADSALWGYHTDAEKNTFNDFFCSFFFSFSRAGKRKTQFVYDLYGRHGSKSIKIHIKAEKNEWWKERRSLLSEINFSALMFRKGFVYSPCFALLPGLIILFCCFMPQVLFSSFPAVLPGAIIKHQNDGHKSLSWLLLFYNLRGFSFQFASLEENETRTSSFATFAVFLFTHQIKLDEETCTLGVEFCLCWKKVIINICFRWIREKCAQKARTNLHFVFLAAAAVGGESSDYSKKSVAALSSPWWKTTFISPSAERYWLLFFSLLQMNISWARRE